VRSTIGVEVNAPAELVFRLVRDVERWPVLLPHYARADVIERHPDGAVTATFIARRPLPGPFRLLGLGLPVAWRSRTWHEPDTLRLRFHHVAGATRGMDVTWRIEPTTAGCRVSIDHDFRRTLPIPVAGRLLGHRLMPAVVDRFFTRPIAGRTLATFKALAETLDGWDSTDSTDFRP
jgi:ribosome-associated toxin RatA of RatAB toxin-antitoxin module